MFVIALILAFLYAIASIANGAAAAAPKPPKIAYFQINCLFYPIFISFRAALSRRKLSGRVSLIILRSVIASAATMGVAAQSKPPKIAYF